MNRVWRCIPEPRLENGPNQRRDDNGEDGYSIATEKPHTLRLELGHPPPRTQTNAYTHGWRQLWRELTKLADRRNRRNRRENAASPYRNRYNARDPGQFFRRAAVMRCEEPNFATWIDVTVQSLLYCRLDGVLPSYGASGALYKPDMNCAGRAAQTGTDAASLGRRLR